MSTKSKRRAARRAHLSQWVPITIRFSLDNGKTFSPIMTTDSSAFATQYIGYGRTEARYPEPADVAGLFEPRPFTVETAGATWGGPGREKS